MTRQYVLLGIILVATKATAEDQKIDFSCHSEMDAEQWSILKDQCVQKISNPMKRQCIDACILDDLGLLRIAYNESTHKRNSESAFVELQLEALMSDNQDLAEAIFEKVEGRCGDLMKKTIQVEKKSCEDWDEIYACVQSAICQAKIAALGEIFPDLRCHSGYRRGPGRDDNEYCRREIENPLNRGCYKLCMLQRFQMFEYTIDVEGKPVPKLGDIGDELDGYLGGLTSELLWRLKGNKALAIKIAKGIHKKCKSKLNDLIAQKKPCEQWDPFYDCIKEAVSCKT